jgi:hypothetical protein
LNIVVDVACKFDIFNAEYVDKLFKFVIVELPVKEFIIFNNVVDVAFKLLMDNVELVDKLFKLVNKKPVSLPNWFVLLNNVVDVAFNLLIDSIELVDKNTELKAPETALFSLKIIQDIANGNEVFIKKVVRTFIDQMQVSLNEMQVAITNNDFDLLYLGNLNDNHGELIVDNIYKANDNQQLFGTHCYLVNNKNIDKIIDSTKIIDYAIDAKIHILSKKKELNVLVVYPVIATQGGSTYSSIRDVPYSTHN